MRLTKVASMTLAAIMVLQSPGLHAQELEKIPKVEWEQCGDRACMDFEATKTLALMRAQYTFLFDLVPLLRAEAATWQRAAKHSILALEFSQSAHDKVFEAYTAQHALIEQAIKDRDQAERFSIFAGALPYVILFGVVCFAGGAWLGSSL